MKIKIKVEKEVEIAFLQVDAGVRYWEDAEVNRLEDDEGLLIPFKVGDRWRPLIDLNTGIIVDWPKGTTADIHYKVCDDGSYHLQDTEKETVLSIDQDYVPSILCPKERGYGDYIIMDVDENGLIDNWRINLSGFIDEE